MRVLSPLVASGGKLYYEALKRRKVLLLNRYPHTGVTRVGDGFWITTPPILAMMRDKTRKRGYRCLYVLALDGEHENVDLIEGRGSCITARPIPYDELGRSNRPLRDLLEGNLELIEP